MHPPLRIAILECGEPPERTKAAVGRYGDVFRLLLEQGAAKLALQNGLHLTYWDVEKGSTYPKLDDIDAILMTGSKHNSFDDDPWILRLVNFVKEILGQSRVRIIGVCFGHQIVGRALGLRVGRNDDGWEVSVLPIGLTEFGAELTGRRELSLYQMHRDIVFGFPPEAVPLGATAKCQNQGMYVKNRYITVQGHPEFTPAIVGEILESRQKVGVFPGGVFEDGMDRLNDPHDGVQVAVVFLKFLLDD